MLDNVSFRRSERRSDRNRAPEMLFPTAIARPTDPTLPVIAIQAYPLIYIDMTINRASPPNSLLQKYLTQRHGVETPVPGPRPRACRAAKRSAKSLQVFETISAIASLVLGTHCAIAHAQLCSTNSGQERTPRCRGVCDRSIK